MRRAIPGVVMATALLTVSTPSSTAAVTLGQVPATTPSSTCSNVVDDWVQPSEISGNPYVLPSIGGVVSWTITSWSTRASTTPGQHWTMKVFRRVSGTNYQVVGHDGPRALSPGALNSFPTSINARSGDLLGMNDNSVNPPVSTGCLTTSPGNTVFFGFGNLADGASGPIASPAANTRMNISAVAEPANDFSFGGLTRYRKLGTASIEVRIPNPGEVTISGAGVKSRSTAFAAPGGGQLRIVSSGKKRRKLNRKGKVTVTPAFTYTPAGGGPRSQSLTVPLKKKVPRRKSR